LKKWLEEKIRRCDFGRFSILAAIVPALSPKPIKALFHQRQSVNRFAFAIVPLISVFLKASIFYGGF